MSAGQGRKPKRDIGPIARDEPATDEGPSPSPSFFADMTRALAAMEELERLRHVASCRECQRNERR